MKAIRIVNAEETVYIHLDKITSVHVYSNGVVVMLNQDRVVFDSKKGTEFLAFYHSWLEKGEK